MPIDNAWVSLCITYHCNFADLVTLVAISPFQESYLGTGLGELHVTFMLVTSVLCVLLLLPAHCA